MRESEEISMSSYNGWTNWATWNVNLWVMNDEGIYQDFKLRSAELRNKWTGGDAVNFVYSAFPDGTPDMESHRFLHDVDYDQLANNWSD